MAATKNALQMRPAPIPGLAGDPSGGEKYMMPISATGMAAKVNTTVMSQAKTRAVLALRPRLTMYVRSPRN
jgi:hypothetical protein